MISKIKTQHKEKMAYVYLRQSTMGQVLHHQESTERQYALKDRAIDCGWMSEKIRMLDGDLGFSGTHMSDREDFKTLVADVSLNKVGAIFALEASRLSRSSADWHRLLELCALTDTVIIDGTTDPDYAGDPIIQIDGSALGAGVNGLTFTSTSDGSEVRGLMITGFSQHGIQVNSGADGITISNNWIGTTGTGSVGDDNGNTGIYIQGANTVVGGTGLNDGNVITNNSRPTVNSAR